MERIVIARPLIFRTLLMIIGLVFIIASNVSATEMRLATNLASGGNAVLVFADNPLKAMTETPFFIELVNGDGIPIKDASLRISLTMPFMPMPPNHPRTAWSEGAYRGTAIFTMAGAWQVNVDIKQTGTDTETIMFDIEMVIMQ